MDDLTSKKIVQPPIMFPNSMRTTGDILEASLRVKSTKSHNRCDLGLSAVPKGNTKLVKNSSQIYGQKVGFHGYSCAKKTFELPNSQLHHILD